MSDEFSERSFDEHQRVFDQIWTQLPEQQNWSSTSWWFFILFPEGEDGYGPRQLMFSVAVRAGEVCKVNGLPADAMDLDRETEDGVDRFAAGTVGWNGDDEKVDDYVINQPAEAVMRDGSLEVWADQDDGSRRGSEIKATEDGLGLEARVVGEDVDAEFEAYPALDSRSTSPNHSMDLDTPLGGVDLVALRNMEFEGEFELPDGTETLEGSCYFQRVCMNVPLFPWKWVWALFPDGTAFSAMIPYLGPQIFRKGYKFFSSNTLERMTIPVRQSGMWEWGESGEVIEFDSAEITPVLNEEDHPDFEVRVSNDQGDYVSFHAGCYGHARNFLERPILGGRAESHWSYNEYMFRMEELQGRVDGRVITPEKLGQGYGTLEYSWGLGL
jgi:hypothetical protein